MELIRSRFVFASSSQSTNVWDACLNASTLPTTGHRMMCSPVSSWIVQHEIYHCDHPDDADLNSYWWLRYSSLACMPTLEIAWAPLCSVCGKHLANLPCWKRRWTSVMSHGRTSTLLVALPCIGCVAPCLMSFSFLLQTCILSHLINFLRIWDIT